MNYWIWSAGIQNFREAKNLLLRDRKAVELNRMLEYWIVGVHALNWRMPALA